VDKRGIGRLEPLAFWLSLAAAGVLVLLLVGVISGAIPVDEPGQTAAIPTTSPLPDATEAAETRSAETVAQPASQPSTEAADDIVLVRAVGGDCWVEARDGSAEGDVLFVGLLAQGTTQQLTAKRVWLRLGAGQNVEIVIGGKRVDVPPGTSDVVLPA
jgi:cytoskeletal protein RodZ